MDGTATIDLGSSQSETVDISIEEVPARVDPAALPVRVVEVDGAGATPAVIDPEVASCRRGRLSIDGDDIALRALSSGADIVADGAVRFAACEDHDLDGGWHRLESSPTAGLDGVQLRAGGPTSTRSTDPTGELQRVTADRRQVVVDTGDSFVLLSGESYDAGWRAEVDGVDLGPPDAFDTQSGWVVPAAPDGDDAVRVVELVYRPQRLVNAAWALTLLGLAVAAWFLIGVPTMEVRR